MKRLFDYCFYRIALFYKKHLPFENYITQGHALLITAFGFYAIALANIFLHLFDLRMSKTILIVIIIPFCVLICFNHGVFPKSDELFEEKKKTLENERFRWFKGLLVLLFVLGSFVSMVFSY